MYPALISTYNFGIRLWERPQAPHVHDFGIFGRVPEPPNEYCSSFETPGYSKSHNKNPKPFLKNSIFGDMTNENKTVRTIWKRRAPKIHEDPS